MVWHKVQIARKAYNKARKRYHRETYRDAPAQFYLHNSPQNKEQLLNRKRDYKYCCRITKRKYFRMQGLKLADMKRKNPREFWKLFRSTSQKQTNEDISLEQFLQHFKSLTTDLQHEEDNDCRECLYSFNNGQTPNTSTFPELNIPITLQEVRNAIKLLDVNKAASFDHILY